MTKKLIIGLVGQPSSGKDTAAQYLITKGFVHHSTSNVVREYIVTNSLGEPKRELMQKVANQLRQKNGPDYLARLVLQNCPKMFVTSGMRNPAEVQYLKKMGAVIIEITAPMEIRYLRAKARGRVGEDINFEQFKIIERKEDENNDPNVQNTTAVLALADYQMENKGDLGHLYKQIDDLLVKLAP